jgi:serine/threonine-protein kinase MRCK
MELLNLQSSLQSEIQAKQSIQDELRHTKALKVALEEEVKELRQQIEDARIEMLRMDSENKQLRDKQDGGSASYERPDSQSSFYRFIFNEAAKIQDSTTESEHDSDDDNDFDDARSRSSGQSPSVHSAASSEGGEKQDLIINTGLKDVQTNTISSPVRTLPRRHHFAVRTFCKPVKCHHCTSLMFGLQRQGTVCEECGYSCHVACAEKAPQACPVPPDQMKRPIGIDPTKGVGTAYEGFVRIPKPGGIRKGWMRQFVVVCDYKLFLYDTYPERNSTNVVVNQVLDMRDEDFSVGSVLESDVIHANKKDIACIFRVTSALMDPPGIKHQVLMLADTEQDKNRWVGALNELLKLLRKNKLPDKSVYRAKEVYDTALPILPKVLCSSILDHERLVVGTEEGLCVIELLRDNIVKIGERKSVYQIELIYDEQLCIAIADYNPDLRLSFAGIGKQKHIRLTPMSALEGDNVESVKIPETKGCTTFCTGLVQQGTSTCLCVAIKRTIMVYELNRTKFRHRKMKEIQCPGNVQYIEMMNERLCVGYPSSFAIYSVQGEGAPIALVNSEDSTMQFLLAHPTDALLAVELSHKEYLLVFSTLGIYVDSSGRRSRVHELMWPAAPVAATYSSPYLTIWAENVAFVYDVTTSEWLQTIPLKRVKPLCKDGALGLTSISDIQRLVYFRNIYHEDNKIVLPDLVSSKIRSLNRKRRFSFKTQQDAQAARARKERTSRIISAPTNFSHVAHMGPDQGMQVLIDLPQAQATGTVTGGDEERMQRVRSMFQPNFAPGQRGVDVIRRPQGSAAHINGFNGGNQSATLGSIEQQQQCEQSPGLEPAELQ